MERPASTCNSCRRGSVAAFRGSPVELTRARARQARAVLLPLLKIACKSRTSLSERQFGGVRELLGTTPWHARCALFPGEERAPYKEIELAVTLQQATRPIELRRHVFSWRASPYVLVPSLGIALLLGWSLSIALTTPASERTPTMGVRCFRLQGQAAITDCRDTVRSDLPADIRAAAAYKEGFELSRLGRELEALDAYREAVRLKPDYVAAYIDMGVALGNQGRWKDAVLAYRAAMRFRADYGEAHYNLGVAFAHLGQWKEALDAFRTAARLNPRDADALNNTGVALNELERHMEALQAYREAVGVSPDYVEAWVNLGISANLARRYEESVAAFAHAWSLRPEYFATRETPRRVWQSSVAGRPYNATRLVPPPPSPRAP